MDPTENSETIYARVACYVGVKAQIKPKSNPTITPKKKPTDDLHAQCRKHAAKQDKKFEEKLHKQGKVIEDLQSKLRDSLYLLDSKYERLTQNLLQEIQELKATCGHSVRNTEQPLDCPMNSPVSATNLIEPPDSVLTGTEPNKQYRKTSTSEKDRTNKV